MYTEEEKQKLIALAQTFQEEENRKQEEIKSRKKKMKFGKRALVFAYLICLILIGFTMVMIYLDKDTSSLSILATAGVGILPIMYGIYDHNSTKINLKHMEECYIPNYDDENDIY